jgi:uncharacterized protein
MDKQSSFLVSRRIEVAGFGALIAATFFMVLLGFGEIRSLITPEPPMGPTISVTGSGTVFAVPDTARVTFTVQEQAEGAAGAQEVAAQKVNAALDLLEDLAIDDADIKTTNYNVYPEYSTIRPCFGDFCPDYEREIIGYVATQTVQITIRDTEQVGEIMRRLGNTGISSLSGPDFVVDDMDRYHEEARALAIQDARDQAKVLAENLGVRLTRVSGFWENTGPHYEYAYDMRAYGLGGASDMPPTIPEIPVGENEILVTVTISYEIR